MAKAWVSVGSNIDPYVNVSGAVDRLRETFGDLVLSPVYETRAVGFEAPPFINLVVGFETERPAISLMNHLNDIETDFGRSKTTGELSSRTLDLDLLTYGDGILTANGKTLPRDDILKYAFVLRPLADVAPDENHPVEGQSYATLWKDFTGDKQGMRQVDASFLNDLSSPV